MSTTTSRYLKLIVCMVFIVGVAVAAHPSPHNQPPGKDKRSPSEKTGFHSLKNALQNRYKFFIGLKLQIP
jgi:hypothetical protein